ncbi:hypothetical protein Tco_1371248 [Tanacetum coccineum]
METHKHLLKDTDGEDVDEHMYRSMIGSLMYLTSSRPDIMFDYPKDSPFDLVAYTNSDYAGASLDRKSTIGGCQFLHVNITTAEPVTTASAPVVIVSVNITTVEPVTSAGAPVTTASVSVSTAEPSTPTKTITTVIEDEDLTIAQTLVKMRSEKSKGGVVMNEPSETAARPTVPPPQHDPKYKGKAKMMQAKLEEEERLAKQRKEDANIAQWDNVQAMMDAKNKLRQKSKESYPLKKESSKKAEAEKESSSKRAGKELESDKSKKQKLDEKVKAAVDDDQEEAKMKEHVEIVPDKEEVVIDAIPLATEPPSDTVWKNQLGNKVIIWKLIDSCGVHYVRFQNMHIYMLVEKRYPLKPSTIQDMSNKRLQADHWNEMCYQLLKLLTKQLKNQ